MPHPISKRFYPKNCTLLQQEFKKLRNDENAKKSVEDARKFLNRKINERLY